jgi:hypothetical protein
MSWTLFAVEAAMILDAPASVPEAAAYSPTPRPSRYVDETKGGDDK